jgi:VWFA-related protein
MNRKVFLSLLLSFCIFLPALAQTSPGPPPPPPQKPSDQDDVVRITTNLVQVDAVVIKDGKQVKDLTADDFEIYEDGKKQTITSFAYVSNVPRTTSEPTPPVKNKSRDIVPVPPLRPEEPRRTIALVVDDLGISAESMGQVKGQLRKFVREEMQPNDLVAIIRTGSELGVLQQFTNDKRILNRAVDQLRWNFCNRVGIHLFATAGGGVWSGCPNAYYSTMRSLHIILDSMAELPGRKSLVIMSDSLPRESQDEFFGPLGQYVHYAGTSAYLRKVAERAIRSSIVIYAVDTQGLAITGITAADSFSGDIQSIQYQMRELLTTRSRLLWTRREGGELLARQTGGFIVRNSNNFQFRKILEDQSGYYLIGYRPTDETFNRRFHHIKAKVKRSGMTLRTRYGFYGISEEDLIKRPRSVIETATRALLSPFGAQDIEVDLTSFFTHDKIAGSIVRSFVYIGAKDLSFEKIDGRHRARVELHGVVFGDNGVPIAQRGRGATMNLIDRDYEHAMRNGLALRFDIPVRRPGAYQVRIATLDKTSSKVGTAGRFVEVPDLTKKKLAVSGIVLGTAAGAFGGDPDRIIEDTGTRMFPQNANLDFAFVTYNAAKAKPLMMVARLFRAGKNVYSGAEVPIEVGNQTDPNRLLVNGSVKLTPDLGVGNYFLQILIFERDDKKKAPRVIQWVDFDIVE